MPSHPREQLPAFLGDALSPNERARVAAHLQACPDCARELRALGRISETLASLPEEEAPIRVRANVRAALRQPQQRNRALPFALPPNTRNLAWGGALTVGAVGLMLLAHPQQFGPENGSGNTPISDANAEAQLESRAAENAATDTNAANVTSAANAENVTNAATDTSAGSAGAAQTPAKGKAARGAGDGKSNGVFADGHAKSVRGSASKARKIPQAAPQSVPMLPPIVAPPAAERDQKPAPDAPAKAKAKPQSATQPAPASRPPVQPRPEQPARLTPQKSAANDAAPAAPTQAPAPANAPAAAPRAAAPPAAALPAATPPAALRAREAPSVPALPRQNGGAKSSAGRSNFALASKWTGGPVTATLSRRVPMLGDIPQIGSLLRGKTSAGALEDAARAEAPKNSVAGAGARSDNDALSKRAAGKNAPAAQTKEAPDQPAPAGAPAVTLTLDAAKAIGMARLILVASDAEIELWRGELNAKPLQIPLPNAALQRLSPKSGQKFQARLEQINGAGESLQSLPLELTWP